MACDESSNRPPPRTRYRRPFLSLESNAIDSPMQLLALRPTLAPDIQAILFLGADGEWVILHLAVAENLIQGGSPAQSAW